MKQAPSQGFVKLHRSILDWEWYDDDVCFRLFFHLLLIVNWEPKSWRGQTIEPGQAVTSIEGIADKLRLSRSTIRRAMDRLKSTGEIEVKSNNHWTTVTVVNWEVYQGDAPTTDRPLSKRTANQRPTSDRPSATTKEGEEVKKLRSEEVSPNGDIGDVAQKFKADCAKIWDATPARLPEKDREAFLAYWLEPNTKGKMRFQGQDFFDHGRRMDTWRKNNEGRAPQLFGAPKVVGMTPETAQAELRRIRVEKGRDPEYGAVAHEEMSPELYQYMRNR